MSLQKLQEKIEQKTARLGVIGLGYVGLPLACLFAEAGFEVVGVDIQSERIAQINQGQSPITGIEPGLSALLASVIAAQRFGATIDYEVLRNCEVIFINVETPVDEYHVPRYRALRNVVQQLGPILPQGALVIVESTIAPGTIKEVILPLLESASGKKLNEGFYVGHCPERVMTGRLLSNLRNVSRVVGGMTPQTAETMIALYQWIVQADLDPADCVTAELVKTTENAYRDVNIAFANEVALICEAIGGDVLKVRELVNKSPGRNMLLPGAGVGGHCIPKDPWLLAYRALDRVPIHLIPAARRVNNCMPSHIADMVIDALAELGQFIKGKRVLILGYAYIENAADTRDSPSQALVARLHELGAEVVIHDPWVPGYQGQILDQAAGCDAAILMVKHDEYYGIDLVALKNKLRTPIFIDGRHIFDHEQGQAAGLIYRGVGQAVPSAVELQMYQFSKEELHAQPV